MRIEIDTNGLFNKLLWILIAGSITFASKKVNDMSNNIAELNNKVAIIMVWQTDKNESLKDHESRIRALEGNKSHAPIR